MSREKLYLNMHFQRQHLRLKSKYKRIYMYFVYKMILLKSLVEKYNIQFCLYVHFNLKLFCVVSMFFSYFLQTSILFYKIIK